MIIVAAFLSCLIFTDAQLLAGLLGNNQQNAFNLQPGQQNGLNNLLQGLLNPQNQNGQQPVNQQGGGRGFFGQPNNGQQNQGGFVNIPQNNPEFHRGRAQGRNQFDNVPSPMNMQQGPNQNSGGLAGLLGQGGLGGGNNGGLLGGLLGGNTGLAGQPSLQQTVESIVAIPLNIVSQVTQVDAVADMQSMRGGPAPSKRQWARKVRRFCHRYPGHPNCRRGQVPQYNELGTMLNTIMSGVSQYLPRVPRMKIRDPLLNVDRGMLGHLEGIPLRLGQINQPAANNIKLVCGRFKCREQPKHAQKTKQMLQAKLFEFEKARSRSNGSDPSDAIQLRFDRTQQLKEGLLDRANLSKIVTPTDNGVFDSDLLLTEKQANFLLNELGKGGDGADEVPMPEDFDTTNNANGTTTMAQQKQQRMRRASLFFEENIVQKWDPYSPVQYVLDDSLEETDKNDVRGAIAEIEKKSCIRFEEKKSAPKGYHINYYKVDSATFCGLSYVGRTDPANPIYLSFSCENSRGVAVHETMHALGVAHQHLRADRDQHIAVDWSNINPQMYDSFVVVDSKLYTSYGVPYDYGSIMHYNAYTAAVDVTKATMKPKVDYAKNVAVLGQRRGMSAADVELLNKMYCLPGCDDLNVYCGAWALKGLCTAASNKGWMQNNCVKSCNLCGQFRK